MGRSGLRNSRGQMIAGPSKANGNRRRILFIYPTGHFFNTPCVPNLVLGLARAGWQVEVRLIRNTATPDGNLAHENISLRYFPWVLRQSVEPVLILCLAFAAWLLPVLLRFRGVVVLAGARALLAAGPLALLMRLPRVYNSLEIYTGSRFERGGGRMFKVLERWLTARMHATIIQDDRRAQLFRQVNALPAEQPVVTFPNAPLEESEPRQRPGRRGFGVLTTLSTARAHGYRVASYSGSLAAWGNVSQIMSIAEGLPDPWMLAVQSRMMDDGSDLPAIRSDRLLVSLEPLPVAEFQEFVRMSDVGIAWYSTEDPNLRFVGLSSGKIAQYWQMGKPIIVNRLPFYDEVCAEYHSGVVVDSPSEIGPALAAIGADYDQFRRGAERAYSVLFRMDDRIQDIDRLLRRLLEGDRAID